jgi:centromeric protein E
MLMALGVQSNPGLIPLAIEQVFSIIESTPEREFLLRVSYIEARNPLVTTSARFMP